jgi:2-polyprenyl-6-methoxyphenol hydroxylase-like FAD-dependent oxidoreductase
MPVRHIGGYSANVERLHGPGYALLGNAGEFLDPVFSSGVTIALRSAHLAVQTLERQSTERRSTGRQSTMCRYEKGLIRSVHSSSGGTRESCRTSSFIRIKHRRSRGLSARCWRGTRGTNRIRTWPIRCAGSTRFMRYARVREGTRIALKLGPCIRCRHA